MSYLVKISDSVETLTYSLLNAASGETLMTCLQDIDTSDMFLFIKAGGITGSTVLELLDGHPTSDFAGVGLCNFLENEFSLKNQFDQEICLIRYPGLPIPGRFGSLSVVTRTLSNNDQSEGAGLAPLAEILDKDQNAALFVPAAERFLQTLGIPHLAACFSYAAVEDEDYNDSGDIKIMQTYGPRWASRDEPWGVKLVCVPPGLDESTIDYQAKPLLTLLQESPSIFSLSAQYPLSPLIALAVCVFAIYKEKIDSRLFPEDPWNVLRWRKEIDEHSFV